MRTVVSDATGEDFKLAPNAAALAGVGTYEPNFERDYGVNMPIVDQRKGGDVVSSGNQGQSGEMAAYTGIYLGYGVYVSQSPRSPRDGFAEVRGPDNSQIKIRLVDEIKVGHDTTNYRRVQ